MEITNSLSITKRGNALEIVFSGIPYTPSSEDEAIRWRQLYDTCRLSRDGREDTFNEYVEKGLLPDIRQSVAEELEKVVASMSDEEKLESGITSLMHFFTEFNFEPNFRFINTLVHTVQQNDKKACEYIKNYFSLMDNSYANEISEKISSPEFKNILSHFKGITPKTVVNNRFKIYYGSAGTGKTTLAQKESDNRCIVCNASMLPSDLMEDFIFVNGQPSFKPSKLWECMVNGTPIVLDEINLLPFDSLRFLQGILDGKAQFDYKGKTVTIADGFQIIGTMNLSIGGMTYGLPEPLVDRCAEIRQFKLTAKQLLSAVL